MTNGKLRTMVVSAAMAALALTLPVAFHMVGLGSKFLPMLLPLLLNGFLAPLPWAVLTGALVPVISSLATGMPPLYPPVAAEMAFEGAVLGGVAAAVFRGKPGRLWPALISAILAGRLAGFAAAWVLARIFGLPTAFASIAMLVQGIPGVLLQLVVVPLTVRQLRRSRNILVMNNDSEA